MKKDQHKGQVALVLVLVMTVVSALAVSLASRSTIDTRIQQTETESVQALLFAQTGIEQLILNPDATITSPNDNYYAEKTDVGIDSFAVGRVDIGSSLELNLDGADFGKLTGFSVYWKPDTGNLSGQPAVFISLINTSGVITDYAFDYSGNNGFTSAENTTDEGYVKRTPKISLSSSISKIRISILGAGAFVKVVPLDSEAVFPSQVKSVKSVGSVKSDANTVKYGLQYDESVKDTVPVVFDYALFSGGSIIQ